MAENRRPGYDYPTGSLVDFHCHMLPGIDDGAKDINVSWEMIDSSVKQGVRCICFTPHFYADSDSPDKFLKRRNDAFVVLKRSIPTVYPVMTCGAEIHYYEGLTKMEELPHMRILGTELLLVEMPFTKWTDRMIHDILEICSRPGFKVIIAHIERYDKYADPEMADIMRSGGAIIQSNAGFFINSKTQRRALKMLENGDIDIIASDSHNMESRPPNLKEAYYIIKEKFGASFTDRLIRKETLFMNSVLA